jgi:predicted ATPase
VTDSHHEDEKAHYSASPQLQQQITIFTQSHDNIWHIIDVPCLARFIKEGTLVAEAFIDRTAEVSVLADTLRKTAESRGAIVAVTGTAGMGKTSLLAELSRRAASTECTVARVACYGGIGAENAYGPFIELLRMFQPRPSRRQRLLRAGGRAVAEGTPDLLSLIPLAGPALRAGALVAKAALEVGPGGEPQLGMMAGTVRQAVCDAVLSLPKRTGPLLVAIDDAHRIDASSCASVRALVTAIQDQPLAFLLAYRPEETGSDHPLRQLLAELQVHDSLVTVKLKGFAVPEVRTFLAARAPGAGQGLSDWLAQVTGGTPFFLEQYLRLLEERRATGLLQLTVPELFSVPLHEPGQSFPIPSSVELLLSERIRNIDEQSRRLLTVGATQGEYFMSTVVEQVTGVSRTEVLDRLYQVHRHFGIIHPKSAPIWVTDTGSDFYCFDHALLRQAFYNLQSPQGKRDTHGAIGEVMGRLAAEVPGIPQEFALEAAHHLHLGRKLIPSAR